MLNEKRIRLMTKLARYESGEGKEELRIARYYRSDYIGLAMFRNFFLASLAYLVILLLAAAYFDCRRISGDDRCVFGGHLYDTFDPVWTGKKGSCRL